MSHRQLSGYSFQASSWQHTLTVLVYYAIANAAAWTLGRRAIPAAGFAGCLLLAGFLPLGSVLTGFAVLALGAGIYAIGRSR